MGVSLLISHSVLITQTALIPYSRHSSPRRSDLTLRVILPCALACVLLSFIFPSHSALEG